MDARAPAVARSRASAIGAMLLLRLAMLLVPAFAMVEKDAALIFDVMCDD